MSGFRIEGTSGYEVESKPDGSLQVALTKDKTQMGGVLMFSENDTGVHTGTPLIKSPETSLDYRLRTGQDTIIFTDEFNAAAQNTALWFHRFTTMTMTQSGGFLVTNSNLSAGATVGCSLHSNRVFTLQTGSALAAEFKLGITAAPLGGQNGLYGFGNCTSATAQPGDGVWFKLTSAGLQGVISYGGSTTETSVFKTVGEHVIGQVDKYTLVVGTHEIEWWCNDELLHSRKTPEGAAQPFLATSVPIFIQQFNSSAVSGSPQMQIKLGNVAVSYMDAFMNKTWAGLMAGMGLNAFQGQNGATMGQTAQWSNITLPTAAAGTNTTAALGTGLGGLFQLNAMASSATDVIVSSYQNPVGSVTQSPGDLYIRGVWIDIVNLGAAVATTATILAVALAAGHTALSLATTESASFANGTAKAPRRLPLGTAAFKVGDPIGALQRIQVDFETPVQVNPGQYVQVIAKPVLGTATASEVFLFNIGFNAYTE